MTPDHPLGRMMALRLNLMGLIIPLEREHGIWYPESFPVDLGTRQGQMLVKEQAYRFCEELLGEALNTHTLEDRREELTDALLFFLSFCIVAGVTPSESFWRPGPAPAGHTLEVTSVMAANNLLSATNLLKARPWRRAFEAPDFRRFEAMVQLAGYSLWRSFQLSGVTNLKQLEKLYLEKHDNALRRLSSGY